MSHHPHRDEPGYEKTDVNAGPTFRAGLYILGAMVVTAAILVPVYRIFIREEAADQRPGATALKVDPRRLQPQGPRLLVAEPGTLAAFRQQEEEVLTTYAWVEKDKGIVRIPVEEAMKIVAERGLPSFPPSAASPAPGGAR